MSRGTILSQGFSGDLAKAMQGPSEGAILSQPDERYRYALWRMWETRRPYINYILLNPSTADATANDPTVTRLMLRTQQLGRHVYGGIVVTNLFAWRSPEPKDLKKLARLGGVDVAGVPKNDEALVAFATKAALVIVGWGGHAEDIEPGRVPRVREMLKSCGILAHALALNQDGSPMHPLYIGYDVLPKPFSL